MSDLVDKWWQEISNLMLQFWVFENYSRTTTKGSGTVKIGENQVNSIKAKAMTKLFLKYNWWTYIKTFTAYSKYVVNHTLSLLFAIRLIGSTILSIAYFCIRDPNTCSTCILTIESSWLLRTFCFSSCFLPFVNYGVFTSACTILALSMQVKPQSTSTLPKVSQ